MDRILQPELLDGLPPDHPDAQHNRRDLRLTNRIMGNHTWLARQVAAECRPGERVIELGAGTGELGRRLHAGGIAADGLDLWPRPADWPHAGAWHQADLTAFAAFAGYDIAIGNLIFHQFSAEDLQTLGSRLRHHVRVVLASEPARRRSSQVAYRALAPLFGANHVSLHDAHVSIAAGFRADELPQLLGLRAPHWQVECHTTRLGAYRMIARRS